MYQYFWCLFVSWNWVAMTMLSRCSDWLIDRCHQNDDDDAFSPFRKGEFSLDIDIGHIPINHSICWSNMYSNGLGFVGSVKWKRRWCSVHCATCESCNSLRMQTESEERIMFGWTIVWMNEWINEWMNEWRAHHSLLQGKYRRMSLVHSWNKEKEEMRRQGNV